MLIQVTQAHIDAGEPCTNIGCPVALALSEATGHSAAIGSTIYVGNHEEPTSKEVFTKIRHFDRTSEMQPFEFEIKYENPSHPSSH